MAANFQYALLTLSPPFYSSTNMSSRSDCTSASQPLLVVLLFSQFWLLKGFITSSTCNPWTSLKIQVFVDQFVTILQFFVSCSRRVFGHFWGIYCLSLHGDWI